VASSGDKLKNMSRSFCGGKYIDLSSHSPRLSNYPYRTGQQLKTYTSKDLTLGFEALIMKPVLVRYQIRVA